MSRIPSLNVPSWRTCNNRRRRKAWKSAWKWYVGHAWRYTSPELKRFAELFVSESMKLWKALEPQHERDMREYGIAITRDGERVDPNDFYAGP